MIEINLSDREEKLYVVSNTDFEDLKPEVPPPKIEASSQDGQIDLSTVEKRLQVAEVEWNLAAKKSNLTLRQRVASVLLVLFAISTLTVIVLVLFSAMGRANISGNVLMAFIGATVLQGATMLLTVVRNLFKP